MKLNRKVTWPVPNTTGFEFIPNALEIKQGATVFRLKNNRYLPPFTFIYTTYKSCARKLDDPLKDADLVRQKKLMLITDRVRDQVMDSKKKLKEIFLSYQQMIIQNKKDVDKCIKMIAEDIGNLQILKKIYKRYMMACHSLLYVKDSMEEAVETYGESALFMKEVLRGAPLGKSVFHIHWRYQELMKLRQEIGNDAKQFFKNHYCLLLKEAEQHSVVVNQLLVRHENYYKEASLLYIRGKELDTALKDLDRRISKEEQFMYAAHKWNERAWRHYSFINFTLFDMMKYLIEAKDLSPTELNVSLWDKMHFIRREHMYNLEILKQSGIKDPKPDLKKLLYTPEVEYYEKKKDDRRDKLIAKKLREIRKRFKGDIPKIFKLLFKKLRVNIKGKTKTGEDLLNMINSPDLKEIKTSC